MRSGCSVGAKSGPGKHPVSVPGEKPRSLPGYGQFAPTSGFGGLHNAIMALSARYLGVTTWSRIVRPSSEAEVLEADTRATGKLLFRASLNMRIAHVNNVAYRQDMVLMVLGLMSRSRKLGRSSGNRFWLTSVLQVASQASFDVFVVAGIANKRYSYHFCRVRTHRGPITCNSSTQGRTGIWHHRYVHPLC